MHEHEYQKTSPIFFRLRNIEKYFEGHRWKVQVKVLRYCLCDCGVEQNRFRFCPRESIRYIPLYTPSGFSIGTTKIVKYFRSIYERQSFLSSKNSSNPSVAYEEGDSPGCTRLEIIITGLLDLNGLSINESYGNIAVDMQSSLIDDFP